MAEVGRSTRSRERSTFSCDTDDDDSVFRKSATRIDTPAARKSSKNDEEMGIETHKTPVTGRKIIRGRRTLTSVPKELDKENSSIGDYILMTASGFSVLKDNNSLGPEVPSFSGMPTRSSKKKSLSPSIRKENINGLSINSVSIKKKSKVKGVPNYAAIHAKNMDKIENIVEYSERKASRAKALLSGSKVIIGSQNVSAASKKQLIFNNVSRVDSTNDSPVKFDITSNKSERISTPIIMKSSKKLKKSVAFAGNTPTKVSNFDTPDRNKTPAMKIHVSTPYVNIKNNFDSSDFSSPMKARKRWSQAISPDKFLHTRSTPKKVLIEESPIFISEGEEVGDLDSTYDVPISTSFAAVTTRKSSLYSDTPKKIIETSSPVVNEAAKIEAIKLSPIKLSLKGKVSIKTPIVAMRKSLIKQGKVVIASPTKVMKASPSDVMKGSPSEVMNRSPSKVMKGSPSKVMKGSPSKVMKESPIKVRKGSASNVMKGSPTKVRKGSASNVMKGSPTKVRKGSLTKIMKGSPSKVMKESPIAVMKTSPTKIKKTLVNKLNKSSPKKEMKSLMRALKLPMTEGTKTPTKVVMKSPTKIMTASSLIKENKSSPIIDEETLSPINKAPQNSPAKSKETLPTALMKFTLKSPDKPSKKSPNKLLKPSKSRRPTFKTSPLKRAPKYPQKQGNSSKAVIKIPVKGVGSNVLLPSTSGVTRDVSKANSSSKEMREKQMKSIINKISVKAQDSRKERRDMIKGVRSNRRFDLLMKMRNPYQI